MSRSSLKQIKNVWLLGHKDGYCLAAKRCAESKETRIFVIKNE